MTLISHSSLISYSFRDKAAFQHEWPHSSRLDETIRMLLKGKRCKKGEALAVSPV